MIKRISQTISAEARELMEQKDSAAQFVPIIQFPTDLIKYAMSDPEVLEKYTQYKSMSEYFDYHQYAAVSLLAALSHGQRMTVSIMCLGQCTPAVDIFIYKGSKVLFAWQVMFEDGVLSSVDARY